jgi:gluconate 2-dehydrogenase gamma chain
MRLTEAQHATLQALIERILPSDNGVGAKEADVMAYVEWVTHQTFFRDREALVVAGLEFINSISIHLWQKPMTACSPAQQDETIRTLAEVPKLSCYRFLQCVINMCLAGFLCDPKYGGNRDRVGWKHMGFELKPLRISDSDGQS